MMEGLMGWFLSLSIIFMVIMGAAYFIPAVIGFVRGHHSKWAILAVNILFGWTVIGWAIALIWSLTWVRE